MSAAAVLDIVSSGATPLTWIRRACQGSLLALLLLALPLRVGAQQQLPAGVQSMLGGRTPAQILQRLEAMGITPDQIRQRLAAAGYDTTLVDAYLGGGSAGTGSPAQDAAFLRELQSVGVSLGISARKQASLPPRTRVRPDTGTVTTRTATDTSQLPVFGMDVFTRRTTQFSPLVTGPVGPDYRLGPGDELILIVTGQVELAYQLNVTREGYVVIPDVGQVFVNGLTLGQLRDVLYARLGKVYSGVKRGPNATTHFQVSLGSLRTNQVYVVGDVRSPGAYQVSSVATILNALYAAGGPTDTGSFRHVILRRDGKEVGEFDLYRYLTSGVTPTKLRLEEGDVVFVPPVGIQVSLRGDVRRPARYELLPGEGLPALIRYAGGLQPSASRSRIQVDRILPPAERRGGVDRELLDVDYDSVQAGKESFPLQAGDQVQVFSVPTQSRDWVSIAGAVYRPGQYQLEPGGTVGSLVARAGGALPTVLTPALHVSRLDTLNGTRSLIRSSLAAAAGIPLREFDEVTLFDQDSLLVPDSVGVYGMVRHPGRYPLDAGADAEDLILMAGGFSRGADPREADVVRTRGLSGKNGDVSRSILVSLPAEMPYADTAALDSVPPLTASDLVPDASVPLQPGDEVVVRQIPGYRFPQRVTVTGEVREPGLYVLQNVDERMTALLRRAGGLRREAFVAGIHLIRDSVTVAMDAQRALKDPGGPDDPVLMGGDSLVVPTYDPTVLVTGAVQFSTRVTYRRGMTLGDVLSAAGGTTSDADRSRVSVQYADGRRATLKRFLGMTYSTPSIQPGSTVFVPSKPAGAAGIDWNNALARVLAMTTALATLIIAIKK